MTRDTGYLGTYIKYDFDLKKMFNDFADKKDLDELKKWLNSGKIQRNHEFKKYTVCFRREMVLIEHKYEWDVEPYEAIDECKSYYSPKNDNLRDHIGRKLYSLKEIQIGRILVQKFLMNLRKLN